MKKEFVLAFLVVLSLFLLGCVQEQPAPTPTVTSTPTPAASPTAALATPALPSATPSPSSPVVPTASPLPAGTLYYDDFESGRLPEWSFDDASAWQLERADDHGFVLVGGSSQKNKYAFFGNASWTDYFVEFKMRLYGGILRLGLRNSSAGAYFVGIAPNTFVLYKQSGSSPAGVVAQASVPQVWGNAVTSGWVEVRARVAGGPRNTTVSVWVDKHPLIEWTDSSNPFSGGGVVFALIDGTRVALDSVNVTLAS
ncbi:MAG: hypothetical protein ACP5O3_02580 [Candidatus Micrarchaeia archaeon]|jgi:hypothetical protein